jgi:acyl-CoA thioesterase-1
VGAGALVAAVGLLGAEVVVAGWGPRVIEFDPHAADGVIPAAGGNPDEISVVWLGDSTAAGVGAGEPDRGVAPQVARAVGRRTRLEVRAVSGARVAAVEGQAAGLAAVDLVVISVGANDATHSLDLRAFRAAYERALDALPAGAAVILLGVPDLGSATRLAVPLRWVAGEQGRRHDAVVREVAGARGATYVDIAGPTGPPFRSDPDRYFAPDHYHPNDEGYRLWADVVAPAVKDALARRPPT